MRQINDPIQPGAEQILLTRLSSLPRPHRSPSLNHLKGKESQPPIRRNRKNNLQENRNAATQFRQKHYFERLNHLTRSMSWKYFTGRLTCIVRIDASDQLNGAFEYQRRGEMSKGAASSLRYLARSHGQLHFAPGKPSLIHSTDLIPGGGFTNSAAKCTMSTNFTILASGSHLVRPAAFDWMAW
jgi:hypothetical protein